MEPTDRAKPPTAALTDPRSARREPRSARRRLTPAIAIAAGLIFALPPVAGAQDADQYQPSPPPTAGGSDDPAPPPPSGGDTFGSDTGTGTSDDSTAAAPTDTAPTGTGASTGASDTVTESSGTTDELPVTGLPAIPVAIAGFVMLLLGTLGVRRFSGAPEQERHDPGDPSGTRRILGR